MEQIRERRSLWGKDLIAPLQQQLADMLVIIAQIRTQQGTDRVKDDAGEDRRLTMRDFYIALGAVLAGFAIRGLVH